MGSKDIVSRHLLKRIVADLSHYLFHLELKNIEVLETQYQRVEERRADIVVKAHLEGKELLVHIEVQNDNEKTMPYRMLRYYTDIALTWPEYQIKQYLIYIGKKKLNMPDKIARQKLNYQFHLIDMHQVDCQSFLEQDQPDALVLAVLCDFKGQDERKIVHYIIQRLKQLTGDNEAAFREYISMLELLSTNRDLSVNIKEEEKMLSISLRELPSFEIGFEEGRGEEKEEMVINAYKEGIAVNLISKFSKLSLEQVQNILKNQKLL